MFAKTLHYAYQTLNPQIKNETSVLIAGSAVRDITPPAGMPKAGYSSNAHSGKGFRTRLKVRVFYCLRYCVMWCCRKQSFHIGYPYKCCK